MADREPDRRQIDISGLDGLVGYRLRRAQLNVFKDFIASFEGLALRPALYGTLKVIRDNPGRRQSELADVLGIKRANIVTLLHELERRGLAERRKSPADRRSHALFVSDRGAATLGEAERVLAAHEARIAKALGGVRERDQLLSLLERVARADLDGNDGSGP